MSTDNTLASLFEHPTLDLYATLTSPLNNGGAVTFQIYDAIEFIMKKKLINEIEFLLHLLETNSLTQNALECFLKHMMFDKKTASQFVAWQRNNTI
jgi:hypothetical protein